MTNPETGYEKAHRQAEQIFREVFSARGMNVREGQIRLCHAMLDTLFGRDVALCDAGVGLGKTYAYLVACILWQLQKPHPMQRPVVISTASITLQNAILEEYIPFLSDALMLMYGKEASNRKQEIDRQHHTIPTQRNQRPKDKHYGNVHNRLWNHG